MSSQKAELQAFRRDKYQLDETTGKSLLQEDAKSDLHNSVNIISEQLYSKDVHFIFELIQNAEDNHYAEGVKPRLHFELLEEDPTGTEGTNGCLAIFNNELGFNLKNIKAVSSIGKSTKAGSKDAGYIGEKGIGFKSVFSVSPSPHIFSNNYHFLFKDKDDVAGLGYIIPYWIDNVPALVQNNVKTYTTCILLPLRADSERDIHKKIRRELNNLDASILLFLNKISELTIVVDGELQRYSKQKFGTVTTLVHQQGDSSKSVDYLVVKKSVTVPSTLTEVKREGVLKRDLCIAFRKDLKPEQKTKNKLYAYLPTELNTGLPFLVNADFLLPASRESVLVDKPWNHWMRDEVAAFAADALVELLLESDSVNDLSQIPLLEDCNQEFLRPIFDIIIEKLKHTAFIPSLSGLKNIPAHVCFADKKITNLLTELNSNEAILPARVLALNAHPYRSALEQLNKFELDAEEVLSYLNAATIALTELPESWFVSLLRWLSKQNEEFHYKVDEHGVAILHKAPLFITKQGVVSCNEQVLFLSSNTYIEYPVLVTPENKTNHSLISQSFQDNIQKDSGTLSFIRDYFRIETLSQSEYLNKVALPFCKDYLSSIEPNTLWQLNCFVVQHWFSLKDETKNKLIESLPFKNHIGDFELKSLKRLVTPESDEQSYIWQQVFDTHEQENFLILSDEYLPLFKRFEKIDKNEFYKTLNISATPLPQTVEVKKVGRYSSMLVKDGQLSFGYETYLRKIIEKLDSTSPIYINCFKLPSICRTPDAFMSIGKRNAFIRWLVAVEDKLLSDFKIIYFYQCRRNKMVGSELGYWLKNNKWLPTQNGLRRPEETFVASRGSRELYGNSVSFLDDDFKLTSSLSEKLGVASEVNTETVLKVLRSWSTHNEKVSTADVMKLYDRLADTGSNLESLFSSEPLIFCPSEDQNWCKSDKAIWKSQKEVLGNLFHWLSDFYPDFKMLFWLNTIKVPPYPNAKSFADAWLQLQTLPVEEKDKNSNLRIKLAAIYERLISHIRMTGINNLESWFDEFVNKALCFTQNYRWEKRLATYISDDKRVAKLFKDKVEFFWRTRGKTHSDFRLLYDALHLKGISEEVCLEVELDTRNLEYPITPILTVHSRLLLAYYYKQFISKSGSVEKDWFKASEVFNLLTVREFCSSSNIPVKYELNGYIEYNSAEVLFDQKEGILIYNTEGKDSEDLVDDLAEEISKLIVTKAFIEEQDHIRPLLNVHSIERFNKRIEKMHWENVLTKDEIEIIKSLKPHEVESDSSSASDTDSIEDDSPAGIDHVISNEPSKIASKTNPENTHINQNSNNSNEYYDVGNTNDPHASSLMGNSNGSVSEADIGFSPDSGNNFTSRTQYGGVIGTGTKARTSKLNGSGLSAGSHNASPKESHSLHNSGLSSGGGRSAAGKSDNEPYFGSPSYRMVSYVDNSESPKSSNDNEQANHQRAKKIGDKAEILVVQYLESTGFNVEHLGGNNPGFDIRATDLNTGEVFFVEVKGILGYWNLMGFSLSKTQMHKCQSHGNNYWLFVVENIVNKPNLYKLINPASRIDNYCFDSNWKQIADDSVSLNICDDSTNLTVQSQKVDSEADIINDEFFYSVKHKDLYFKCFDLTIGAPDVGFELQDIYAEIVCELEFAWPKYKKGIYTTELRPNFDGWEFKTVDEVLTDLSWLDI
jgi:hypothetical protein